MWSPSATFDSVVHKIQGLPAAARQKLGRARQAWQGKRPKAASHSQLAEQFDRLTAQLTHLTACMDRHTEQLRVLVHQQQCQGLDRLDRLRALYPWPARRPTMETSQRGWPSKGRDMIDRLIADRHIKLILEIGTHLGHSALRWLEAAGPEATVICVDPFSPCLDVARHGWTELIGKNLYYIFLANCWDRRQQIIPIRGYSPQALFPVHQLGVQPELIYIDGSHQYEDVVNDLEYSHRYWPHAILCGDDWRWPRVQEAVRHFAQANNFPIRVEENTWLLGDGTHAGTTGS